MVTQRAVLGLALGIMVLLSGCSRYVDYVPLTCVDEYVQWRYEPRPDLLTDRHVQAMKKILTSYGMKYCFEQGRLQITKELAEDQELLWNLTEKAFGLQDSRNGQGSSNP